MAVDWFVVVVPAMARRSDRSGGRFQRVGGADYMGAGQAAKQSHLRAPLSASPTTLPLIEHKHLHTSTTRVLRPDSKLEHKNLNGLTVVCMIWVIFDMPPELTMGGLQTVKFRGTSTRESFSTHGIVSIRLAQSMHPPTFSP